MKCTRGGEEKYKKQQPNDEWKREREEKRERKKVVTRGRRLKTKRKEEKAEPEEEEKQASESFIIIIMLKAKLSTYFIITGLYDVSWGTKSSIFPISLVHVIFAIPSLIPVCLLLSRHVIIIMRDTAEYN